MAKVPTSAGLLVGVTGGIGSGKSTLCGLFAALGRTVLRADDIARDLTENDPAIRRSLRREFGEGVFLPGGKLDRKGLAAVVFADPARLERLNRLVHPAVFAEIERLVGALPAARRTPYVIVEAALIYESGMDRRLDYVIAVHASVETRLRRVMQRDGATREEVLPRMHAQMAPEEKLALADFSIANDGTPDDLRKAVLLFDTLLAHLAAGGNR